MKIRALSGPSYIRMIALWVLAVVISGVVWPLFLYFHVLPEKSPVPLQPPVIPHEYHDSANPYEKDSSQPKISLTQPYGT